MREHLQRPTLDRQLSGDPLFRDAESDDIMRPSIIPGPIQEAQQQPVQFAQPADLEAEPASTVTFSDTPVMLGEGVNEPLSGSEEETLPSISEVNMFQAPSPTYRRHASFTGQSSFGSVALHQQAPRSPFEMDSQGAGPSSGPVLSDRPILSAAEPAMSRRFSRKSGKAALFLACLLQTLFMQVR